MKKCPICFSNDLFIKYPDSLFNNLPSFDYNFTASHSKTYEILKCRNCGHAFSKLPSSNIWENYKDIIDQSYLSRQEERVRTSNRITEIIHKFVPEGRLLDVGCATGDFLESSRKYYDVEGLELSSWSAQIAESRGFKIYNFQLNQLPVCDYYDIVTLWGVIEHLEDPYSEMSQIYRIIKKNGIVCLWTGDINSIPSKVLGKKWWYIQGQHIQLFSNKSLRLLLAKTGFSEIGIFTYPYITNFKNIYSSLGRYPTLQGLVKPLLLNKFLVNKNITLLLPGEMLAIYKK